MEDKMRIIKYENLIDEVRRRIDKMAQYPGRNIRCYNLALIYEYDKLNDYGKLILEKINNNKIVELNNLSKNLEKRQQEMRKLVLECHKDGLSDIFKIAVEHRHPLEFIFWAMMVLTVDDTKKEEHLSLICDFAKMVKVSDEEMLDIVTVIKVIYDKTEKEIKFMSDSVPVWFRELLRYYKYTSLNNGVKKWRRH